LYGRDKYSRDDEDDDDDDDGYHHQYHHHHHHRDRHNDDIIQRLGIRAPALVWELSQSTGLFHIQL